jgi:hypothetical protein
VYNCINWLYDGVKNETDGWVAHVVMMVVYGDDQRQRQQQDRGIFINGQERGARADQGVVQGPAAPRGLEQWQAARVVVEQEGHDGTARSSKDKAGGNIQ